jgi:hypothetical protein
MAKRIAKLVILMFVLMLFSSVAFGQIGFDEPKDITTREERAANFINAVKSGDTTAFRLVTYDVIAGIYDPAGTGRTPAIGPFSQINENTVPINIDRDLKDVALSISEYTLTTPNVIDTIRIISALNNVSFVEYLCDGDVSPQSETRQRVIRATLQGLYNLDPRIRLTALEWLRRLRPDGVMFRDVERAVEYETVASSYEKYRPKNIDIPSIDEPGAYDTNFDKLDYYYNVDESTIYYPFDEYDAETGDMVHPDDKKNYYDENGNIISLTEARPNATQLDARKWGNGNPFDPDRRLYEIYKYIDVMMEAGALRRFRNTQDGYLLGYQYRLGAAYQNDFSQAFERGESYMNVESWEDFVRRINSATDGNTSINVTVPDGSINANAMLNEIMATMVPIGHGDKYFYRNVRGRRVMGNSWAELIKLREFIVRAIWYDKIVNLELNSLVIISKDSFKTLYLSIDGEAAEDIPFLSTGLRYDTGNTDVTGKYTYPVIKDPKEQPRGPMLDQRHIPVLIQGLLKNPVYSTKWVIARALKDIYVMTETTAENKSRINWALRQAKYDALAKDVIKGAVLHEELITVGKIDFTQEYNYQVVALDSDERYPNPPASATYAGGVYIPRKRGVTQEQQGPVGITGFAIPNDEVIARRYTELVYKQGYNFTQAPTTPAQALQQNQLSFADRVMDSFSFYRYVLNERGNPVPASAIVRRVEGTQGDTDYTAPVVTYYSNRDEYLRAKAWYYQQLAGNPSRTFLDVEPKPLFNVDHYNRVVNFINRVYEGDNEVMTTVAWEVVESAQLLVMYRLFLMMESEMNLTGNPSDLEYFLESAKLLYERNSRLSFFDAFLETEYAERIDLESIKVDYTNYSVAEETGTYKIGPEKYDYFWRFIESPDNDDVNGREVTLDNIASKVKNWSTLGYTPTLKKNFTQPQRSNFISASLSGLYNKDPRVRLTAIHWLRRLGPSEEMFEEVRKARGILRQDDIIDTTLVTGLGNDTTSLSPIEEYDLDQTDPFNDLFRQDRPDTSLDRVEFFDTNIYHRNNYPELFEALPGNDTLARYRREILFNSIPSQRQQFANAQMDTSMIVDVNAYPPSTNNTGDLENRNRHFHAYIYIVSQDFQKFNYYRLNIREEGDPGEIISLDDMKPTVAGGLNYPRFEFVNNVGQQVLEGIASYSSLTPQDRDLLQIITIANPLYTEDRYEFEFKSWGMYQFKSPSEELEKLYRFILRERLVNRIRSGREADIFVGMSRFEFSILALPLDYEYVLRIPMSSFFGLDPNYGSPVQAGVNIGGINILNGDYNPDKAFVLPKGELLEIANEDGILDAYTKYPIFRENQIAFIAQGVDNPNFQVQKGTAEFLIRFYNYYSNLGESIKRDIRDAMFYYKQDDIVIEELTLAIEAEQPQGRAIIKAGSRLGNELNPGGVRQYRQILPAELRRDVRRTINREVQSFDREIANILGVRRRTAVGATDTLGYFSEEDTYVPVKPADEADVQGEERADGTNTSDDDDDDDND